MLIKMVVSVSQVMDLQGTDMYYLRELSKMLSHNFWTIKIYLIELEQLWEFLR